MANARKPNTNANKPKSDQTLMEEKKRPIIIKRKSS
jgi:hypothetical protein